VPFETWSTSPRAIDCVPSHLIQFYKRGFVIWANERALSNTKQLLYKTLKKVHEQNFLQKVKGFRAGAMCQKLWWSCELVMMWIAKSMTTIMPPFRVPFRTVNWGQKHSKNSLNWRSKGQPTEHMRHSSFC